MCGATSEDESQAMNNIAYYQAEIDYRREQMQRDQLRAWRRAKAAAAARMRAR